VVSSPSAELWVVRSNPARVYARRWLKKGYSHPSWLCAAHVELSLKPRWITALGKPLEILSNTDYIFFTLNAGFKFSHEKFLSRSSETFFKENIRECIFWC
jgi:hypothetical protein